MTTKTGFAALLLTAGLAAPAAAQQTIDARRPAAATGRVEIENMTGSIHVVGWSRDEVAVKGTLGRGAEGLQLTGGGSRTRIEVETSGNPHGVRSDLEIHVPAGSRLEIQSFAADITVGDVTGEVRAESVNGSISVSGAPKEVEAQTVAGNVDVTGVSTRVHAESVNGSVTLKGIGGEIEANTVNGRLDITGASFERCRLETVSGDMKLDGELRKNGSLEAETVSGGIELRLPASAAADFTVSTFSGDVVNELGPPAKKTSRFTSEKAVEFQTGSGGARVEIKTLSGDIALRKR